MVSPATPTLTSIAVVSQKRLLRPSFPVHAENAVRRSGRPAIVITERAGVACITISIGPARGLCKIATETCPVFMATKR